MYELWLASEADIVFLQSAVFQLKHRCKKITEAGLQACHINRCVCKGLVLMAVFGEFPTSEQNSDSMTLHSLHVNGQCSSHEVRSVHLAALGSEY